MNILIVGNGFDLSHYLPTKYDHFMDVMDAIETHQGDSMTFDELFSKCREDWFIEKTKEYYLTNDILLEKESLDKIRNLLKGNSWYQYFKHHVKEVKTWIDFELKILEALKCICKFLEKIDNAFESFGDCGLEIYFLDKGKKEENKFYMPELDSEQLILLKLIIRNNNYGKMLDFWHDTKLADINKVWFVASEKTSYGFSKQKYLAFLMKELDEFTDLFNLYLTHVVQMETKNTLRIISDSWFEPSHIYSFNYTNTYQRIYGSVDVDYLHGSHGEFQNIVLGISDIEDDYLKKLKAYGFTKYHQKLFKDTDYLFLDSYKEQIKQSSYELHAYDASPSDSPVMKSAQRKIWAKRGEINLNFLIWGHSLDYSDKDYIIDLFSLNDDMDRNVRVTVFFYDKTSKFSLLNNLLAILDKNKVEQWMKKGWLKFEPNPEIDFGVETKDVLIEEAS